jgi:hypothetical protein
LEIKERRERENRDVGRNGKYESRRRSRRSRS